ncbi:DUF2235 domain-containing protein [bacterium]|nr:DUF2235 domain-containing protein [bacterium]
MKKLALFLDGTWNKPDDNTNVWRLRLMVAETGKKRARQLTYYDRGVGTDWFNRIRGGVLGTGLSENVRQAYQWLMEHYEPGDEVYIFGFSRGAYTARSLAGMIAKCGLLKPGAPMPVCQVFERYRKASAETPLYHLEYEARHGRTDFSLEERWLLKYSKRIDIQFIGVWDTVGALGIPIGRIPGLSSKTMFFHHTRLSKIYKHAVQALAVDEHRPVFRASLWTKFIPKDDHGQDASPVSAVEQRWFVGSHSNVGGGNRNDLLPQVPLAWIQKKASEAGLAFRTSVSLTGDEHLAPVQDSFKSFFCGIYRVLCLFRRHYRIIGLERQEKKTGWVETVNETIDATVFDRWRKIPGYRPVNLVRWAARKGKTAGDYKGDTDV